MKTTPRISNLNLLFELHIAKLIAIRRPQDIYDSYIKIYKLV